MTGRNCTLGLTVWRDSLRALTRAVPVGAALLFSTVICTASDAIPADPGMPDAGNGTPQVVVDPPVDPLRPDTPTDCTPTDGTPTDGTPTDGTTTDETPTDGMPPEGKPSDPGTDPPIVVDDTLHRSVELPPDAEPIGGGIYDPVDVIFYSMGCDPPRFLPFACTSNQRAVAGGFDAISGSATGNVQTLIEQIRGLSSSAGQQMALSSLSGEVYGTSQSIGLQIADRSLRAISQRIINNELFLSGGDSMLVNQRDISPIGSNNAVDSNGGTSSSGEWHCRACCEGLSARSVAVRGSGVVFLARHGETAMA